MATCQSIYNNHGEQRILSRLQFTSLTGAFSQPFLAGPQTRLNSWPLTPRSNIAMGKALDSHGKVHKERNCHVSWT